MLGARAVEASLLNTTARRAVFGAFQAEFGDLGPCYLRAKLAFKAASAWVAPRLPPVALSLQPGVDRVALRAAAMQLQSGAWAPAAEAIYRCAVAA